LSLDEKTFASRVASADTFLQLIGEGRGIPRRGSRVRKGLGEGGSLSGEPFGPGSTRLIFVAAEISFPCVRVESSGPGLLTLDS
jgi:hypothetical protein